LLVGELDERVEIVELVDDRSQFSSTNGEQQRRGLFATAHAFLLELFRAFPRCQIARIDQQWRVGHADLIGRHPWPAVGTARDQGDGRYTTPARMTLTVSRTWLVVHEPQTTDTNQDKVNLPGKLRRFARTWATFQVLSLYRRWTDAGR